VLYHGTDAVSGRSIQEHGVQLSFSRTRLDFGPDFYATTSLSQARRFASRKASNRGSHPAVLVFRLAWSDLVQLETLWFVRSTEDFWTFVAYCRRGPGSHSPRGWIDTVVGPVVLSQPGTILLPDSDQVSFHTQGAIDLINTSEARLVR
jgi:hypothetical protein